MKIILTQDELAAALRGYSNIPAGYGVDDVKISRYDSDFCTIELEKIEPIEPAPAPAAQEA